MDTKNSDKYLKFSLKEIKDIILKGTSREYYSEAVISFALLAKTMMDYNDMVDRENDKK